MNLRIQQLTSQVKIERVKQILEYSVEVNNRLTEYDLRFIKN